MGLPRMLFYVVSRVMAALIAGIGLYLDYTGGSIAGLTFSNWKEIVIYAIGAALALTIGREIDLALQQRPKITLLPKVYRNQALMNLRSKPLSFEKNLMMLKSSLNYIWNT